MGDRRCGFVGSNQTAEVDPPVGRLGQYDDAAPVAAMWVGGRAAAAAAVVTAFAASDREWVLAHLDA